MIPTRPDMSGSDIFLLVLDLFIVTIMMVKGVLGVLLCVMLQIAADWLQTGCRLVAKII